MRKLFYLFLLLTIASLQAQNVSPQVINSTGGVHTLNNGFSLSDNVGEVFVTTIGSTGPIVTQGFLQPRRVVIPQFTLDLMPTDVSCAGKGDGRITTSITTTTDNYTAKYIWTPTTVCPTGDCASIDSLDAGAYSLQVVVTYSVLGKEKNDTLSSAGVTRRSITITDVNGPCKIKIFSGVTLNYDGVNDFLYIENIEEYPNNRLTIYNRWGVRLFDEKGYDNSTKIWPAKDADIVPSTYFYVLEIGDGSKPIKGWVEVIKN